MEPIGLKIGDFWAEVGPKVANHGPNFTNLGPKVAKLGSKVSNLGPNHYGSKRALNDAFGVLATSLCRRSRQSARIELISSFKYFFDFY